MDDAQLKRRLSRIERHLRELDEDLSVVSSAVRTEPSEDAAEIDATRIEDVVWQCERCRGRLALYDPTEDVLRIREKELTVHVRTGPGGFIRAVCRRCGHINEIHDEQAAEASTQVHPED